MAQLLNLDELVELERTVLIRGIEYPIVERSVGIMLDSIKVATRAAKQKSNGVRQNEESFFTDMLKTLSTIIPDCPEIVLRGLTMRQMVAVLEFCNSNPEDLVKQAQAQGDQEQGGTDSGEA